VGLFGKETEADRREAKRLRAGKDGKPTEQNKSARQRRKAEEKRRRKSDGKHRGTDT
jgi:hypothetical protein